MAQEPETTPAVPVRWQELADRRQPLCVVGLGYVGLPLAVALSKQFAVIGLDVSARRIEQLRRGEDVTRELDAAALRASGIEFTSDPAAVARCPIAIVAVPTPVDASNIPDLALVRAATESVARHLPRGGVVVYESTVYPGVTEEICVPLIARLRGWTWKHDFFVGYSPERVNPGDREHTIEKILKVVSGDTPATLELLARVYGAAITAGVFRARDIKTAEAAKVIENTQRDLNIALINELAIIFQRMGLDTRAVLEAAATKWNFLRFEPGLVGGHCIGVDPYYLTYRAQSLGYQPEVILAGRRINDSMGKYVAEMTVKKLLSAGTLQQRARVLILGLTFKEDLGDIRNTKVVDIDRELRQYGLETVVHDPHADAEAARHEYGLELVPTPEERGPYDAVVVAVKHRAFRPWLTLDWYRANGRGGRPVVIDVKALHSAEAFAQAGIPYWRL